MVRISLIGGPPASMQIRITLHMGTRHAWLSKRAGYSRHVRSSEQTECQLNFVYVFKGKTEGLSCVLFEGL